jgi:hypothetical protein
MKHFVATTKDVDSYFLNFSDGEPAFQINGFNYQGRAAAEHTAKQVRRIKDSGINVLSYFISESSNGMDTRSWELFKQCYGDTAKCINPRNMVEVARSMNEMFLKKNAKTL